MIHERINVLSITGERKRERRRDKEISPVCSCDLVRASANCRSSSMALSLELWLGIWLSFRNLVSVPVDPNFSTFFWRSMIHCKGKNENISKRCWQQNLMKKKKIEKQKRCFRVSLSNLAVLDNSVTLIDIWYYLNDRGTKVHFCAGDCAKNDRTAKIMAIMQP